MLFTFCKKYLPVVLACIPVWETASAQDTLSVARVTASSRPSSALQSAPLESIDNSDFQRLGMNDLWEAVRGFSGVSIKDYGGIGGVKTVSVRGLGAQHTGVSYDGVAVSDLQSGQIDIGRFSLDNVELVTLSIGQGDNIFQTARMFSSAAALEIRTLKPRFDGKSTNISAGLEAGSFKTWNPSLRLEQKFSDGWSMSASADYLSSDGTYPFDFQNGSVTETLTRDNSDVSRLRGELNLYGRVGSRGELSVKTNYLWSERGLPGAVILYNPTANERLWDRNFFGVASYSTSFDERWSLKANLRYNYAWNRYYDESEQYAKGYEDDHYLQCEYYGSVATQLRVSDELRFTLAEDLFYTTLDSDIPECAYPRRLTSMTALAGQWRSERLSVTASLLATAASESVSSGEPSPNQLHLSPSASLSYKLLCDKNLRVRASYRDGFRMPSFNDLYYSRVGSRDLKPERAHQFNLGLTWAEGFTASIDGFFNHVNDKIATIPTMFIWKTLNIGEVNIWGLDANVAGEVSLGGPHRLSMSAGYSWHRADEVIPYFAEHSGSATLSWINPWVNVSYVLNAVGDRYALPEEVERNLVEGYFDHSVSLGHDFTLPRFKISLRGEVLNIGDINYCVIKNYPMPGRNYRLTLKIIY